MATKECTSPSGKYKLVITYGNDNWKSQGEIFVAGDEKPIEVVMRNYRSFPFEWIEGHPLGSFLVCGSDYQGQTILQLDTGDRHDFMSEGAEEGCGFCWSSYEYDPETKILFVEGCYWACPYEWRLYDFSDPMKFKHLKVLDKEGEEFLMEFSQKRPTVEGNIFTFYEVRTRENYEKCYQVPPTDDVVWETLEDKEYTIVATQTFKLRDGALHQEETWLSDLEKAYQDRQEATRLKHEEQMANYKATDPLYLAFIEGIKDPAFSPEKSLWRGCTHAKWCSEWKGDEPRWGKNIVLKPHRISVEWAEVSGPILVQVGNDPTKVFMDHSVGGMQAALAYAKQKALEMVT